MLATAVFASIALSLAPQQNAGPSDHVTPRRDAPGSRARVPATRAGKPPVIDGVDDDEVWSRAVVVSDFREWQPTEGKPPRFRTEAKIAYDATNLYVFVRAFDPHPDSIVRILERRDSQTPSDMIWLFLDSNHDRRNGYAFAVNAAGVKLDEAIYNDGNEDRAWDAVWDVATRIDSLGWTAEFRIPLSQMRYARAASSTFGIIINRDIFRYTERVSWPLYRPSLTGMVSQFGDLDGLDSLRAPRRLELTPYAVAKSAATIRNNSFATSTSMTGGGDLKFRLAPNVILDATVNPDFGQVEADPSVLNLTAYESFFDERRPFFVAGRGIFQFDVNCSQVNCRSEGLYYSRRIGRTPQLAGTYGDTVPAQPTPILGAAKLIGTFPSGFQFGLFEAATQRATGARDTTFEPATNYAMIRARQDLRHGNSSVGAMLTAVQRAADKWSSPYLSRNAYAGGIDARHRFLDNRYEVSATLDASRVDGDPRAILALQTDAVHYYQRPDAGLPLDSTRRVLSGDAEEVKIGKVGGAHLMFESAYQRRSAGFEINDLGYLQRADQQSWSTWIGVFDRKPSTWYNILQWNHNWVQLWTAAGLPQELSYNSNVHITFKNNWSLHTGGEVGLSGMTFDDRLARGGPAVRQDGYFAQSGFVSGDDRKAIVPAVSFNYFNGGSGHGNSLELSPQLSFKMQGRFSASASVNWARNEVDKQWYGLYTDGAHVPHYTFAHLDQHTASATLRLNYTFTPDLSLQAYLQPFVSKGTYARVMQLSATPRAARYDDRFAVYADTSVTNNPGGFNYKAFQSNLVFRWEYRPGSALFVVWNQGRQGTAGSEGNSDFPADTRDLMRLHPANTVLVKWSYWLNR